MTVFLGNYPIATDNGTAYERQRNELKAAIQTYGTDHISGVTVGNEFMLKLVFFSFMPYQARINVLRVFFPPIAMSPMPVYRTPTAQWPT